VADRVYISSRVERLLGQMAQQTNAPAVAAQRARQIIDSLIQGSAPVPGCAEGTGPVAGPAGSDGPRGPDGPDPVGAGLLRYRKDKRVKNSLKFNLGQGFRLICIKEKKAIYVMFLGDHDSCDAWLDHFTRKRPHKADQSMAVFAVDTGGPDLPASPQRDGAHDPLPQEIPQKLLRQVFKGLCAPG
jgi:hypothetical protein